MLRNRLHAERRTGHRIPALLFLLALGACTGSGAPPAIERSPGPQEAGPSSSVFRLTYGPESSQFGELGLPEGAGPFPVAILIHGGCWSASYDLRDQHPVAEKLRSLGIATWNIEYRRVGERGGGWPGTFQDVGMAADHLRALSDEHPLDLGRVIAIGHSAGGHLALWLAGRDNLSEGSALWHPTPLPLTGVVSLAGVTDLRAFAGEPGSCNAGAADVLGGRAALGERVREGSPIELLPLYVPSRLVHGTDDDIVPIDQSAAFATAARAAGDDAELVAIPGAGHFDLIAPDSPAWRAVEANIRQLLGV